MTATAAQTIPAVVKRLELNASPARAFEHFANNMAAWWPLKTHSRGEEKTKTMIVEPNVGGRMYEVWTDGGEHEWGKIVAYDPPRRIAFTWALGRPDAEATQVDVTFKDLGDGRCELTLVHDGWERRADAEAAEWRDKYHNGWDFVLGQYAERLPS